MFAVSPWPLTFEEDAPWFAATYIGFGTFFDTINILGNQAGASDPEKIGWVCRYAGAESEYWELIDASPEPNSTFTAFQDQVCALYPELDPARCFSYHDLKVLVRRTKTCTDMTLDEFRQYSHDFTTCHDLILGKPSSTFFAKIFVTSKPINMFLFDEPIINTVTRLALHQARTNPHPWTNV